MSSARNSAELRRLKAEARALSEQVNAARSSVARKKGDTLPQYMMLIKQQDEIFRQINQLTHRFPAFERAQEAKISRNEASVHISNDATEEQAVMPPVALEFVIEALADRKHRKDILGCCAEQFDSDRRRRGFRTQREPTWLKRSGWPCLSYSGCFGG